MSKKKRTMRIRNRFVEGANNLSSDHIISPYRPGLKTEYGFYGSGLKRGVENNIF